MLDATGPMTVKLPNRPIPPIAVSPKSQPITVVDDRGRIVAKLQPGECATFEIKRPPRWQFWRKPFWKRQAASV
jgi:hypothetical protein